MIPFRVFSLIWLEHRDKFGGEKRQPQNVLLHDANRGIYHHAFKQFPHQVLLTGYRANAGGIWLGSKQPVIDNLLDVERHQRIWKACRAIGKVLRC